MKKISANTTVIIKSLLPLIGIIILFIIVAQIAFSKVNDLNSKIAKAKEDNSIYTQKLDLFKSLAVTGVVDANEVSNSLPDTNPALSTVSQIKMLATNNGALVDGFKTAPNTTDTSNINSVTVSFKILGIREGVQNFLMSLNTIAPLTVLNKIKLEEKNGAVEGEIAVNSYWSPYPKALPSEIADFQDLTADEKQVLSTVRNLTQPAIMQLPPADSGSGKPDPFSQ